MNAAMDSNNSRPVPPANTGSAFKNWLSDLSLKIVHFERRFDPWFRPAFDATLRDPLARLVTALINRQRQNEERGDLEYRKHKEQGSTEHFQRDLPNDGRIAGD